MIELRQQFRIPVDMQVVFAHAGATNLKEGTLFDLSTGGCAVATTVAVPSGVP